MRKAELSVFVLVLGLTAITVVDRRSPHDGTIESRQPCRQGKSKKAKGKRGGRGKQKLILEL